MPYDPQGNYHSAADEPDEGWPSDWTDEPPDGSTPANGIGLGGLQGYGSPYGPGAITLSPVDLFGTTPDNSGSTNTSGVINTDDLQPNDPTAIGAGGTLTGGQDFIDPLYNGGQLPSTTSPVTHIGLGGQGGVIPIPLPVGPGAALGLDVLLNNGNLLGGGGGGLSGLVNSVGNIITDPVGSVGSSLGNLGNSISNVMGPWGPGGPAANQNGIPLVVGAGSIGIGGNSGGGPSTTGPVLLPATTTPPPSENDGGSNPDIDAVVTSNDGGSPGGTVTPASNISVTENPAAGGNTGVTVTGQNSGPLTSPLDPPNPNTPGGAAVVPTTPGIVPPVETNPGGGGLITPITQTGGNTTVTLGPPPNNPTTPAETHTGGGTVIPIGGGTPGTTTTGTTPTGGSTVTITPTTPTVPTTTTNPPLFRNYGAEGAQSTTDLQSLLAQISQLYGGASGNYANTDYSNYTNIANQLGGSNGVLTGDANAQTAAANTALRTGNLNDVSNLSAQALALRNNANPNLFGTNGSLSSYTNGAQQNLQYAQGIQNNAGYLSPEDVRNSQQAAREAWAARGLVNSPGAIGAEILNRSDLTQQRQQQAFTNTNTALTGMQGAVQAGTATQFDPFSTILGSQYGQQTNNAGSNQNLFGQASGISSGQLGNQFVENAFNPYNAYSNDVYGTNTNAANAQYISGQNNAAALQGANTSANATLVSNFLSALAKAGASGLFGTGGTTAPIT